jgi:hypothetical protein
MKLYRWTYFAFMVLTGALGGLALVDRNAPLPWVLVGLCMVLALIYARRAAQP